MKKFLSLTLRSSLKLGLFVALIGFVTAKGPENHASFIRYLVGTKTVRVMGERSGGTGFYITTEKGNTYILTNRHVCEATTTGKMGIVPNTGDAIYYKTIVKKSEKYDLCVLNAPKKAKGLGLASDVNIGETIGLVGHPKLQPLTLSRGELIGYKHITLIDSYNPKEGECKGTVKKAPPFYALFDIHTICLSSHYSGQITAYSRGGSSGSPLINFYGNIVGVLFAGNPQDQFESYVVPLSSVKEFLKEL